MRVDLEWKIESGKWKIVTVKISRGSCLSLRAKRSNPVKTLWIATSGKICPPRNDGIFVKFCNKILKNSKVFRDFVDKYFVQTWLT